ncbi:hypothetical protein SAMN05192551_101247 [Tindallia magadiensis]|uniref:Flagellar protein FliO/FliZ n=1 Tax=Tindallia magadiensis TaxID=69895 RepID=A0A1I3AIT4_9FIRM|nr:hypothetical protein [Tindallia magadiensis]SFH49994.1 hypothetical protein SAMN05192551_101247 [Tindallia magadiensis]
MGYDYFISMFLYLIMTTGVIFVAYCTTIWIAKKTKRLTKNRHSGVLEKVVVTGSISIYTIKNGLMVYIIASNGKSIEQLDKMTFKEWVDTKDNVAEYVENEEYDKSDKISWSAFAQNWRNYKTKRKEKN